MKKELYSMFNEEVSKYRSSLQFYASNRQWTPFKKTAGKLFDYVESIELTELERRFFIVFKLIMAAIFCIILIILHLNPQISPDIERVRKGMILLALAVCGYEFFFFMSFRFYMDFKTTYYLKRREIFIRNIEKDFRNY